MEQRPNRATCREGHKCFLRVDLQTRLSFCAKITDARPNIWSVRQSSQKRKQKTQQFRLAGFLFITEVQWLKQHSVHPLDDVSRRLWRPPRFSLGSAGVAMGGCDVAPRYLYWQHIYHTLSLIAFICMGPSPVMLLEVAVPVCSFLFFFFCPKAMQIHKHLFVAKQEGCVLLYTAKNGTVSSLIPTIILGKCLHALSHRFPVMFKSAWKKHIWRLWFLVMGLK